MRTKLILPVLISLLIMSCDKDDNNNCPIGKGFEIYPTVIPYCNNLEIDYSTVDFDTILLKNTPILRYYDLIKYDTLSHKLTLNISHDSLKFGGYDLRGTMFVVTIDKNPIYCGFYWPVISSIPCNWVFIEEPYQGLDNLENNKIVISFDNGQYYPDPRLDNRIIDRLVQDGKIK